MPVKYPPLPDNDTLQEMRNKHSMDEIAVLLGDRKVSFLYKQFASRGIKQPGIRETNKRECYGSRRKCQHNYKLIRKGHVADTYRCTICTQITTRWIAADRRTLNSMIFDALAGRSE